MIRRQVIVHGQVQGVGFRYTAKQRAERLGLSGYTRNLPDGTVEVDIEGTETAVAAMLEWLDGGPMAAEVSSLVVTELEPIGRPGFEIRT